MNSGRARATISHDNFHQSPDPCLPQCGNYLPALDKAERYLLANTSGSCALLLLFLSDGRPSDRAFLGPGSILAKQALMVTERVQQLSSRFGRRLTVGTIGFSKPGEDFTVLRGMAQTCQAYGSRGIFQSPALAADSLRAAFTTLTSTLTATKTEMTAVAGDGGLRQRTVRDIRRESANGAATIDHRVDHTWQVFRDVGYRVCWPSGGREWEQIPRFASPSAIAVAFKRDIIGEGAERMVRKFREVGPDGVSFVGPPLVAKESRFVEDLCRSDRTRFHRVFCQTQRRAQQLAEEFNRRLALVPGAASASRVRFLDCSVYVVHDPFDGEIGVLVEKQLDTSKYMKWNNNNGFVDGQHGAAPREGAEAEQHGNDRGADADGPGAWLVLCCWCGVLADNKKRGDRP